MGGKGSGSKPREYPADLVETIRSLYESGLTIAEVQAQVKGCKVQHVMVRYGIPRRPMAKRNQRGDANHMWRGDEAGYQALHLRVASLRGKPSHCEWCGTTEGRFEWANLTGKYGDVADYERLCASCHKLYDAQRRRETGRRTMPEASCA
jgi:hypothetical protein